MLIDNQELEKAREIVRRLRKRELYKFAGEALIPHEQWDKVKNLKEADIVSCSSGLAERDIIINTFNLNYGRLLFNLSYNQ